MALHEQASNPDALPRFVRTCMDPLQMDGAFVSLIDGPRFQTSLYASDVAAHIESVQFSLGEGPCFEAFATCSPVLAPDLAHASAPGWSAFAAAMAGRPIGAIFAFPLRADAIGIGVIGFYCRRARPFSDDELAIALEVADLMTVVLLGPQLGSGDSSRGVLAPDHAQLHKATGMLVATVGVSAAEAVARLRGHAFVVSRSVDEVAQAIVTGMISPWELD
ncbi:GAF and ANTAR domain-containing protein [Lentzea guizhouensis]|uniref:GAF and ANTAR domain-containing protein n=1 Tax=Lentzea guizhouensis TaxID=1586287 RepID=UPI001C54F736|nr:GAF and ANTAR domain-containing protein [Lentzea guizhouensis]